MRNTSHRRRYHTDRIVANCRARYLREMPGWWERDNVDERKLTYGRLADRDPWDCGRHCEMCHWEKFNGPRRAREKRQWRRDWL